MLFLLFGCPGEANVSPAEPYCDQAVPTVYVDDPSTCAALFVCCDGDPAADAACWYQSEPPSSEAAGLVWRCGSSLSACAEAEDAASYWSCFVAAGTT